MSPEAFIERYERALATQTWSSVDPLIHPNVCVTFSDGSVHKGKAAVRAAYEANFQAIENETYRISNVHWVALEADFAVYLFDFHWSGTIGGQGASGSGRGTAVIAHDPTGWVLVAEHLGPNKRG